MKHQPEIETEFCQWREPSGGKRRFFKNRIRMNSPELVIDFCLLPILQGFSLVAVSRLAQMGSLAS